MESLQLTGDIKWTGLKISLFFIFLFILQIVISYVLIRYFTLKQRENNIADTIQKVQNDITVKNGIWDINAYNADPDLPDPNSDYVFPLYVITTDGFVIERSRPITGLLDSSDFKRLDDFQTPQMVTTPTNENWRALSKPITENGKTLGVILVSYYNPSPLLLTEIDKKLSDSLKIISDSTHIVNGRLKSDLDPRKVDYEISYEVVDKFNKILVLNGRAPSFIDVSYIDNELHSDKEKILYDSKTQEPFLTLTQPLKDSRGQIIGVVVAGQSVSNLFSALNSYLFFSVITGLILTFPLSFLTVLVLRRELIFILKKSNDTRNALEIDRISFDKKASTVLINSSKVRIPFASNQYYLCDAVFSFPKRRWEIDELLDKFGEHITGNNWRKVYDAMLAINKKTNLKLIKHKDKTYQFNPDYITKLTK